MLDFGFDSLVYDSTGAMESRTDFTNDTMSLKKLERDDHWVSWIWE